MHWTLGHPHRPICKLLAYLRGFFQSRLRRPLCQPPTPMATLGTPERVALIKENLVEVLDFKIIEDILAEGRHPKIYWGTISSPLKAIQ
jgi:hypothetical protein